MTAPATPPIRHVVWDWNGTLLDDFAITVAAASAACEAAGGAGVDAATYRLRFTRPVRLFYERLLERALEDDEWVRLADDYHDRYRTLMTSARPRPESVEAIARVARLGLTQSVLSMGEHDALIETVPRHLPAHRFVLVEGSRRAERTDSKRQALEQHLRRVGDITGASLAPEQVLLVGDTLDDAMAAASIGARIVLLADGAYDREELAATLSEEAVFAECLSSALRAGLGPMDHEGML
ncbi:HAD family hydrolase [Mangrovihabitans endophyticus]|uniref:Putative phosphatase n=1 Tax=Mangrovihabitans endophyticus TaxID=1751298 RepID=A0A8J3FNW2_9ACTN|nr:HAD family hydrolase [Mangrovihabitans endophyticus]GGK90972.1 putative phosphatase [Mangrovihabitans endophyticus]